MKLAVQKYGESLIQKTAGHGHAPAFEYTGYYLTVWSGRFVLGFLLHLMAYQKKNW